MHFEAIGKTIVSVHNFIQLCCLRFYARVICPQSLLSRVLSSLLLFVMGFDPFALQKSLDILLNLKCPLWLGSLQNKSQKWPKYNKNMIQKMTEFLFYKKL